MSALATVTAVVAIVAAVAVVAVVAVAVVAVVAVVAIAGLDVRPFFIKKMGCVVGCILFTIDYLCETF
jgi:hypothetical protein